MIEHKRSHAQSDTCKPERQYPLSIQCRQTEAPFSSVAVLLHGTPAKPWASGRISRIQTFSRKLSLADQTGSKVATGSALVCRTCLAVFFTTQERLRDPRQRRLMIEKISFDKITDQEGVIRNISRRGLSGAMQRILPTEGARIAVTLANGNVIDGVVRWTDGPCFGLALDFELHSAAIADGKMSMGKTQPAPKWEVSRFHRLITPHAEPAMIWRV